MEEMVAMVEFNDPFIDPMDVSMSRQQLMEHGSTRSSSRCPSSNHWDGLSR
jgi:hypothetical protein